MYKTFSPLREDDILVANIQDKLIVYQHKNGWLSYFFYDQYNGEYNLASCESVTDICDLIRQGFEYLRLRSTRSIKLDSSGAKETKKDSNSN